MINDINCHNCTWIILAITTTSKQSTLEKVFNQEDEELFVAKKQRKLVPIEYSEEEQQAVGRSNHMSSDERKSLVQNLIKSIPTEKDELFAYNVKWDCLDDVREHGVQELCGILSCCIGINRKTCQALD